MAINTNRKKTDRRIYGFKKGLPSAGPVESPQEGRQAQYRDDMRRSVYDGILNHSFSNYIIRRNSMAESVTRHASTPSSAEYFQLLLFKYAINNLKQYGYVNRKALKPTNSLPEKVEGYRHVLGVVGSGRLSVHG
jgi:hypothetical protein